MFDNMLELSYQYREDSNKWSNRGFGEKKNQVESIEVNFTPLIQSSYNVNPLNVKLFFYYLLYFQLITRVDSRQHSSPMATKSLSALICGSCKVTRVCTKLLESVEVENL